MTAGFEFSAREAREALSLPDGFDSERGDRLTPAPVKIHSVSLSEADLYQVIASLRFHADAFEREARGHKWAGDAFKATRKTLRDEAKNLRRLATELNRVQNA